MPVCDFNVASFYSVHMRTRALERFREFTWFVQKEEVQLPARLSRLLPNLTDSSWTCVVLESLVGLHRPINHMH